MIRRSPLPIATLLVIVAVVIGCRDDEPEAQFRRYTASDVVALLQRDGTFDVHEPRLVSAADVFGVDAQISTSDIIYVGTPMQCTDCGMLILSFVEQEGMAEARLSIEEVNAGRWTVVEKRNLLVLFDTRWSVAATSNYGAILCRFDATCPEG